MTCKAVAGGMCQCSFGVSPSGLVFLPKTGVMINKMPVGVATDSVPMLNVMSFGMCTCPANPAVITATAAALGVFTPAPCVPILVGTWIPSKPTVVASKIPVLSMGDKIACAYGGMIVINSPGQFSVK